MANVALWVKPKCCVWKDVVRSDLQTSVRDPRVDGMLVTNGQGMLPTVLGQSVSLDEPATVVARIARCSNCR